MFKLVKYEFRKSAAMTLTLAGLLVALEAYFLIAVKLEENGHIAASMALLFLCAAAASAFVFVRGVTSYSGELKSKSSYLLFMTPTSTLKIVGSKFLYTFLNGLVFGVLFAVIGAADLLAVMKTEYSSYAKLMENIQEMLRNYGVYLDQMAMGALFMVLYVFLELMATIGLAYLAITVGHTLFRDKKWRWLPSLGMFAALMWGLNWTYGRFPSLLDEVTVVDLFGRHGEAEVMVIGEIWEKIGQSLMPTAGVSLAVILASMFLCAYLLKKKVSL